MATTWRCAPGWTVPVLAILAGACGGAGPASPSASSVPTVVTVVSGDTAAAAAGASVSVGGQSVTTDAGGRATLSVTTGSPIAIDGRGFFPRETLWRGDPVFQLWPIRADAGETFVNELVYNQLVSDGSVTRPVAGVTVVLSADVRADSEARAAQEQAAAVATAATDGAVPFVVADAAPTGGIKVDVRIDPADAFLAANPSYGAITRVTFPGNRITSGSTTYRGRPEASALSLAAHEMGHILGLGHPSQRGLMSPATIAQFSDFSRAEAFAIHMMRLRPPGNRPPDNDRGVSASAARRRVAVGCPWVP
jgi:hypothetical protein